MDMCKKLSKRLRRRAICDLQMRRATLYIASFRGRRSARVQISWCWLGVGGRAQRPPPKANQTLKHSTTKEITRNYVPYRPFSEGHLKCKKGPKATEANAANKLQEKGPKALKSISERTRRKP